jgi:asparagine synthase (glutamine-hydrolysing)
MPGIFGIIDAAPVQSDRHHRELASLLDQMAGAMSYDGGYVRELVCNRRLGAFVGRVGWPASSSGHNSRERSSVTIFTTADTTVRDGPDRSRPHGGFAGVILDDCRRKCTLFNDRYGAHRLFLHADATRTFFSSEAKAVLAIAPGTRAFDPVGLAELLACGCTLGAHSLFQGIEVLEPGTQLTFVPCKRVARRRYFIPAELEAETPVSGDAFQAGFAESLASAVNEVAREGLRVGMSLTGGLDSRMILASLDASIGSIPCYTFGSMYRATLDVITSQRVAAACGHSHQVIELDSSFLADLPAILDRSVYISDGYIGLSGAAELYLNQIARTIAPTRMTGNWGGELMRGVHAFKFHEPKGGFVRPGLAAQMSASAEAFATAARSHPLSYTLFHQMPHQGYGRHAIERSQVIMRSPFLFPNVVAWLYRAPLSVRASVHCFSSVIGRRPELLRIPTDSGQLGAGWTGFRFARVACRRIMSRAEYMTSHGAPDWIAFLSSSIPRSLLETRFLGVNKFQHFRVWLRRELSGFARDVLRQERTALEPWFDMARVAGMLEDHVSGRTNYTDEIDKVLTVAIARRTLLTGFDTRRRECA